MYVASTTRRAHRHGRLDARHAGSESPVAEVVAHREEPHPARGQESSGASPRRSSRRSPFRRLARRSRRRARTSRLGRRRAGWSSRRSSWTAGGVARTDTSRASARRAGAAGRSSRRRRRSTRSACRRTPSRARPRRRRDSRSRSPYSRSWRANGSPRTRTWSRPLWTTRRERRAPGMMGDVPGVLDTPLRIGGMTVRNRLYRAPVLEGAGDGDDAADRYARHFVENARHGVGLIIQGSSCIFPEGRTSPGMTCVDTREKVMRLAPMVDAVHREGAAIVRATRSRRAVRDGGLARAVRVATRRARSWPRRPSRWLLRPAFRGVPVHVMSTDEVHAMTRALRRRSRRGRARPATTACSSARPTPSCSTSSCRRSTTGAPTSSAGPSQAGRACCVSSASGRRARRCRLPVHGQGPGRDRARSLRAARRSPRRWSCRRLVEEWGFDAVTPVERVGAPRHDVVARRRTRLVHDEQRHDERACARRRRRGFAAR